MFIYFSSYQLLPFYYLCFSLFFFFFNDTATTDIYTLSLHDALPILRSSLPLQLAPTPRLSQTNRVSHPRSEEHTSELQSPCNLVCRLLLEKKKRNCCRRLQASWMLMRWLKALCSAPATTFSFVRKRPTQTSTRIPYTKLFRSARQSS